MHRKAAGIFDATFSDAEIHYNSWLAPSSIASRAVDEVKIAAWSHMSSKMILVAQYEATHTCGQEM